MRINKRDIEALVHRINKATDSPQDTYTRKGEKLVANIGNYHLSWAYGGVKLERICSDGGGVDSISTGGYGTKRELYHWMQAFLAGIGLENAYRDIAKA